MKRYIFPLCNVTNHYRSLTLNTFIHQLTIIVNMRGFSVSEQLTINGQTSWPRERELQSFKSFAEANDLLLALSNCTPTQFTSWLETNGFHPWPVDELVKSQPFELPIVLHTITLEH